MMEKAVPEGLEGVCVKAEPCLLQACVKEEPSCLNVRIKDEPSSEYEGTRGVGEPAAAAVAALYADHVVKDELVLGPELVQPRPELSTVQENEPSCSDVCVKEEPSSENEGARGVSEAATAAALYADHVVKDELVLGPALVQPRRELSTVQGADDVYKSKWFASEYFAFLNDKDKPLSTTESAIITSNNNTENVNESISNDVQSTSDSASTIQQVSTDLTSDIQQAHSNALSFTQQAPSDALSSIEQAPSNSLSSIQQTSSNSASSTQQQHNTSFRNKRRRMQLNKDETDVNLTEAVGLLKHSVQYLSKEEDCYTSFGNHIAHELKKYNSRTFSLGKTCYQ